MDVNKDVDSTEESNQTDAARRQLTVAEIRQNERNTRLVNRSKNEIVNGWKDVRMPELTDNRPPSYWQDGYRKGAWQPLDDIDKRFPGMNRNRAWFEKRGSTHCTGYVNINDLLSGKCKGGKVLVN